MDDSNPTPLARTPSEPPKKENVSIRAAFKLLSDKVLNGQSHRNPSATTSAGLPGTLPAAKTP